MPQSYFWVATAAVVGLASNCLVHLLLCQVAFRGRPYRPLFIGSGAGLVTALAVSIAASTAVDAARADLLAQAGLNLLTYLALAWGYFHFVNLNIASLRIRMLLEVFDGGGTIPVPQLLARYNTEGMIELRIERLVCGGHLVEREHRLHSGKNGFLLIARLFEILRRVILGRHCPPRILPGVVPPSGLS